METVEVVEIVNPAEEESQAHAGRDPE
jgi:hypothetical protein